MNIAPPYVSVLLPVLNGETYLAAAIESVLAQTLTDFELLIVDDGSTDGTAEIINNYRSDARLRSHRFSSNRGLVASLNFGLAQCRGELVARLDADDVCKPMRLALQASAFARDSTLSLHATAYDRVDADGTLLRVGRPPITHAELVGAQLSGNRLCHSTIMFRRDAVIELGGYDGDWFPVEDYDLWLRLCVKGHYASSATSSVTYLDNPSGISNTHESAQAQLHRMRSLGEISRLSGRRLTQVSTGRQLVRAVAAGRRRQRHLLKSRGVDSNGLGHSTYGATMRLLSDRSRWKRHAIVFSTAPLLPGLALIDRYRGHRD